MHLPQEWKVLFPCRSQRNCRRLQRSRRRNETTTTADVQAATDGLVPGTSRLTG